MTENGNKVNAPAGKKKPDRAPGWERKSGGQSSKT